LDWPRLYEPVQSLHKLEGKIGFGIAGITLAEERLALKVGFFDDVTVDDRQHADTSAGQGGDYGAANSPGADDGNPRFLEPSLTHPADLRQDDVPRVPLELSVRETHCPVEPKPPVPRPVSPSTSTSRNAALRTGAGTSCAIRSPRRTSNGSVPRLARMTFTSPR